MVVSLTLNHRGKPTVGRADPPVVPVTDEISPNKNFQFIRGQAFRIVTVIEKLAFHSGPHAFTSSISAVFIWIRHLNFTTYLVSFSIHLLDEMQ